MDNLIFGVSAERGSTTPVNFQVLNVRSCESNDPLWVISSTHSGESPPPTVSYGSAPDGFVTDSGPSPLRPGCYRASVIGTGRAEFLIAEDGSVSEVNRR